MKVEKAFISIQNIFMTMPGSRYNVRKWNVEINLRKKNRLESIQQL